MNPLGQTIIQSFAYSPTIAATVNLDCVVCHIDYNQQKLTALKKKYGPLADVHSISPEAVFLLTSNHPDVSVRRMVEEFQFETRAAYWDRSRRKRSEGLPCGRTGRPVRRLRRRRREGQAVSDSDSLFPTVIVGAALSPHTDALLHEAWRLVNHLGERLVVVHVTTGDAEAARAAIAGKIARIAPEGAAVDIVVMENRKPADSLIEIARERMADLIFAGALVEDSLIARLMGSVARTLAREAPCSVLLLPSERDSVLPFRRIVASVDASDEAETALSVAAHLARWGHAEKLAAVWQYEVPGLAMALAADSDAESRARRDALQRGEEIQLDSLLRTADLYNVPVEAVCEYGDRGWVVSEYARAHAADLLIVPAPAEKTHLLDRILTSDIEAVLRRLACTLLLVRQTAKTPA